jgi:DNA-binding transcriptional LysR family regulator
MASDDELPDSATVARRMFTLERGLFAAPGLVQAAGPVAQPDDLLRLPLITAPGETRWTLTDAEGQAHTLTLQARLSSANAGVRRDAALQGLGVTCVTASFCADAVADGRLLRLLPQHRCAPLRVYALLPGGRTLQPPKVQVFLDALAAHADALETSD